MYSRYRELVTHVRSSGAYILPLSQVRLHLLYPEMSDSITNQSCPKLVRTVSGAIGPGVHERGTGLRLEPIPYRAARALTTTQTRAFLGYATSGTGESYVVFSRQSDQEQDTRKRKRSGPTQRRDLPPESVIETSEDDQSEGSTSATEDLSQDDTSVDEEHP